MKEAGFAQEGKGKRMAPPDKIVVRRDDFAYVPTLEELIDACGDRPVRLTRAKGGVWVADIRDGDIETNAPPPPEAVARLWLALNKK